MPEFKRIVCLANSRKQNERCIAGREWINGQEAGKWVRPVSARDNQQVSFSERQYEDGSDPQVLDIIDIPLLEPCPTGYQTENWLLHSGNRWRRVSEFSAIDLHKLVDLIVPLWTKHSPRFERQNFARVNETGLRFLEASPCRRVEYYRQGIR